MKIDSYTHFACPAFMAHLEAESGHPMVFRGLFSAIPELLDIDLRIRQVQHVMCNRKAPRTLDTKHNVLPVQCRGSWG